MPAALPKRLDKSCIKQFLNSFDNVLTDCDGVLWVGDTVLGQANEAINQLRALGKKVFYVTNNSSRSRNEYVSKFEKLGFIAKKEEIVSPSYVMAEYLKQQNLTKKVYVIGSSGMTDELEDAGIEHTGVAPEPFVGTVIELASGMKLDPDVGAVAVGFDIDFSFPKLMRAASHLNDPDCLFIGTNTDERFPLQEKNLVFPGTGCLVRCVETAARRPSVAMGKPSKKMFSVISDKHHLQPSRTLMIGDKCTTDILFGKNCGLHTLIVLTGVTDMKELEDVASSSDEEKHKLLADYYLPELGDLIPLLNV